MRTCYDGIEVFDKSEFVLSSLPLGPLITAYPIVKQSSAKQTLKAQSFGYTTWLELRIDYVVINSGNN